MMVVVGDTIMLASTTPKEMDEMCKLLCKIKFIAYNLRKERLIAGVSFGSG